MLLTIPARRLAKFPELPARPARNTNDWPAAGATKAKTSAGGSHKTLRSLYQTLRSKERNRGFKERQTICRGGTKMKSSSWKFAVALVAVLVCGAVMIGYAQQTDDTNPKPAWAGHRHGDHMAYMAKALNLTDAQKEQIKSIMQANRASNRPLMQQMEQNRL